MSTTPTATRDGRPKAWDRPNITGGMSRNCENMPIRKARRLVVHTCMVKGGGIGGFAGGWFEQPRQC